MHGLINRAIEVFVRQTYGNIAWVTLTKAVNTDITEFEPMLSYENSITDRLLAEVARFLDKDRQEVLEDIGTFLVSHPSSHTLRRLLRFSGDDFVEFLHSLEDLPARAQLAVHDLRLPQFEVRAHHLEQFSITVRGEPSSPVAFGHVLIGLLRALADDYGALVLLEHKGARHGVEVITANLLLNVFSEGRRFELGARAQ